MGRYSYSCNNGLFLQADDDEDDNGGSLILPHFGLKYDGSSRWQKFWRSYDRLETNDDHDEQRLIFLARQAGGVHNLGRKKYGDRWGKWCKKDGDDDLNWVDADLTQDGFRTALTVHAVMATELEAGLGLPDVVFTSPMTRSLVTTTIVFSGLYENGQRKYSSVPPIRDMEADITVVEDCRGQVAGDMSSQRRTKTYIEHMFPDFKIESGFDEDDSIWDGYSKEDKSDVRKRVRNVLNKVFDEPGKFAYITSHGEFIDCFLDIIGHRNWDLDPGGVIPLLVYRSSD